MYFLLFHIWKLVHRAIYTVTHLCFSMERVKSACEGTRLNASLGTVRVSLVTMRVSV